MLEALVVATATTGLFVLAKGVRGNERFKIDSRLSIRSKEDHDDDLPCPWCYAPTDESDSRCRACGQSFG